MKMSDGFFNGNRIRFIFLLCFLCLFSGTAQNLKIRKQAELCMIGDSITWAGHGDCFRKSLLKHIPELVFIGTHSACWGYSHAGEGGNTTTAVLKRIDNRLRVPDSANYHVLVGINDAAATLENNQISGNAEKIAGRIFTIVEHLEKRPITRKIFVGTILPCFLDAKGNQKLAERYRLRDRTGQAVNVILRRELLRRFPGNKVELIEYENVIRPVKDWEHLIYLHPTPAGYDLVAETAAAAIREKLYYTTLNPGKYGVSVTNLWNEKTRQTSPLIPGWYTMSFETGKNISGLMTVELSAVPNEKLRFPLKQKQKVKVQAGQRAQFVFMTGYEGYTYSESAITIKNMDGEIKNIQIEKMRPHQMASRYGTGTFLDDVTPIAAGEKRFPLP